LTVFVLLTTAAPLRAQTATGSWEAGFDHSITAPAATDFLAPFLAATNTNYDPPGPSGAVFPMFGWDWGTAPHPAGQFNAVHMSLIPKGATKHRGKVLVWNRYPVVFRPGSLFDPSNDYWVFQAWSIVDPAPGAVPKFRNFVLPIERFGQAPPPQTVPMSAVTLLIADLFCTGHAWSQHGDLVVAGGARFDMSFDPNRLPPFDWGPDQGAKYLYLFDPDRPSSRFPGSPPLSPPSMYAGEFGAWLQQPTSTGPRQLHADRYYPTVTLSQKLSRLNNEVVMVSGGEDVLNSTPTNPKNTFETWEVRDSFNLGGFFLPDSLADQPGYGTYSGVPPNQTPNLSQDWLQEYPRIHLWGDGTMFCSGYAYKPGRIDMEQVPTALGQPAAPWDLSLGQTGSNWLGNRKYGSSVHFVKFGPFEDIVIRLCGHDTALGATASSEVFIRSPQVGWSGLGNVPPGTPRDHTNAVVLPCGSILVFGGDNNTVPVLTTAMYTQGLGWQAIAGADSPTVRDYHATAVLLEDGRVLVGGGEGRHSSASGRDYDIFKPWYLQGNPPPPRPSILSITNGPPNTVLNQDDTWILSNGQTNLTLTASLPLPDPSVDAIRTDFLARLVLVAPGSTTHHSDMSARYVELTCVPVPGTNDKLTFGVPGGLMLPRGYYMVFALSNTNIPSVAEWVKIQ
jgi:hypothetical protein